MTDTTSESVTRMLKSDSKVFYGIFVASFTVIFVVALASQVLTWQWRSWLPGAEAEKSMIGGVKAAVYTFMSHLT